MSFTPQRFKGDPTEIKLQAVASPLFDQTDQSLDEFYAGGFDCSAFLLMLYDEGRMPFSSRIPRPAFVDFIKEALDQFPVTGTFEAYLFVLRSVFGEESEIVFEVPAPGKLGIDVNAVSTKEFDFVAREFIDGSYIFYNMTDDDGSQLIFRGLPGIDTIYELNQLFSEIMPCGIAPTIALTFYSFYDWVAEEPGPVFFNMTDGSGNQILFYEVGG